MRKCLLRIKPAGVTGQYSEAACYGDKFLRCQNNQPETFITVAFSLCGENTMLIGYQLYSETQVSVLLGPPCF